MDAEVAPTAGSVVSAISHEPSDQQKRGSSGKWSDATWTHGKQLEQLLQQDTTLRGDNRLFEAHADIRLAAMETTMNNASPWTHFLLISPGVMSWRSVVFCCLPCSRSAIRATARRLLLVVKVVFVVFPISRTYWQQHKPYHSIFRKNQKRGLQMKSSHFSCQYYYHYVTCMGLEPMTPTLKVLCSTS